MREAAFIAKKIYSGVSFTTRAATLKTSAPELHWVQQGTAHDQLLFNQNHKPWDDLRVRQAVSKAISRQQFIDTAPFGSGKLETPSRVWFSASALGQDELKAAYGEDLTEAKRLLTGEGANPGVRDWFASRCLP